MTADVDQPSTLRFCIPATADSWAVRFEQACSLLERVPELPQAPIRNAYVAANDRDEVVDDRLTFLQTTLGDPYRQVILSNDRDIRYTREGVPIDSGKVLVKGNFTQPGQSAFDLTIQFPAVHWRLRERLLIELGDLLEAHSGQLTPRKAELTLTDLFRVVSWPAEMPSRSQMEARLQPLRQWMELSNLNIPPIKPAAIGGVRQSDLQPEQLGWLNYWSDATARWLGFPDPALDSALLERSQRTASGAWLVRTTHEPLDLMREDHVRSVAAMYERFPKLGIRFGR